VAADAVGLHDGAAMTPNDVLAGAATAASALLAVPAATFAAQCLLGSLPRRPRPPAEDARLRMAVVVPAHDEAAGIAGTVRDLLPQLAAGDRLVVVADNCADDTAAVARAAANDGGGASATTVLERRDAARRGKGHALAHALAHLDAAPPDVVVFVDADCRIAGGSLRGLAAFAAAARRPAQAEYLLAAPPQATPLARLGAFAVLVRNRVRPRGLARLGLPCQITGSGFALPWALTAHVRGLGGDIVEDLALGLTTAAAGAPCRACPDVRVTSVLPGSDDEAARQRRRWEHGQLATAWRRAPGLVLHGLLGRPALLALGLDLLVPPLALLVLLLTGAFGVALAVGALTGQWLAATVAGGALGAVAAATLVAWAAHARGVLPVRDLARIPFYVVWKLPLYLGLWRGRETTWRRTARDGEGPRG
jgi:cellulose synthase/poly-beta-1,6-N-acetylglucosamine synthase-like glycosyltransferase